MAEREPQSICEVGWHLRQPITRETYRRDLAYASEMALDVHEWRGQDPRGSADRRGLGGHAARQAAERVRADTGRLNLPELDERTGVMTRALPCSYRTERTAGSDEPAVTTDHLRRGRTIMSLT
jgi:hypothetical protein